MNEHMKTRQETVQKCNRPIWLAEFEWWVVIWDGEVVVDDDEHRRRVMCLCTQPWPMVSMLSVAFYIEENFKYVGFFWLNDHELVCSLSLCKSVKLKRSSRHYCTVWRLHVWVNWMCRTQSGYCRLWSYRAVRDHSIRSGFLQHIFGWALSEHRVLAWQIFLKFTESVFPQGRKLMPTDAFQMLCTKSNNVEREICELNEHKYGRLFSSTTVFHLRFMI